MENINEKQQWEELKNIKQKKKKEEPNENGIKPIIGGTKKESTNKQKNDIGKIKLKNGRIIVDISGQKFGKWTVLKYSGIINNNSCWKCECDCGTIKNVRGDRLKSGNSKCCGCIGVRLDLVGDIYGRLIVLKDTGNDKHGKSLWECKCDCGNIITVVSSSLKRGLTKSCGCLHKEIVIKSLRIEKGESGFNILFYTYKRAAKRRNLEFNLTREQIKELTQQNCYYCGETPKQISINNSDKLIGKGEEWSKYIYNGIDRKDNDKGYIIENCVPCCKICNRAKSVMFIEEFKNWIKKIYSNIFKNDQK